MKANELMIGDWIYRYDKPIQITDGIYRGKVYTEDMDIAEVKLNPIPLTAEILEKNGLEKIDFSHYQINDRTLVLDADGKWDGELSWHWVVTEMSTNSKGQNVVLDYYVATLNYVHELQRALRCCGLDKLAENFRV